MSQHTQCPGSVVPLAIFCIEPLPFRNVVFVSLCEPVNIGFCVKTSTSQTCCVSWISYLRITLSLNSMNMSCSNSADQVTLTKLRPAAGFAYRVFDL